MDRFEQQAREWVTEGVARLTKFLQEAVPVLQEAAETVVETIREKLPVVQEAVAETLERLVAELTPPEEHGQRQLPAPEEDEARRGIAELEDYLKDR